ncbi:hypothetical protein MNV49_007895 [Pseudohyphozyma bogoriensis]|nr:hypothetical protein MNV49_007895 [Pseudohyphozyma bogoriensis]
MLPPSHSWRVPAPPPTILCDPTKGTAGRAATPAPVYADARAPPAASNATNQASLLDKLPLELISEILAHVCGETSEAILYRRRPPGLTSVLNAALVSRDFAVLARPFIWGRVTRLGVTGLFSFLNSLRQFPERGVLVQSLAFNYGGRTNHADARTTEADVLDAVDEVLGLVKENLRHLIVDVPVFEVKIKIQTLMQLQALRRLEFDQALVITTDNSPIPSTPLRHLNHCEAWDTVFHEHLPTLLTGSALDTLTLSDTLCPLSDYESTIVSLAPQLKLLGLRTTWSKAAAEISAWEDVLPTCASLATLELNMELFDIALSLLLRLPTSLSTLQLYIARDSITDEQLKQLASTLLRLDTKRLRELVLETPPEDVDERTPNFVERAIPECLAELGRRGVDVRRVSFHGYPV